MSNLRKFVSMSAVAILGVTNLLTPLSFANAATGYDALTEDDLKQHALRFIMPNKDVYLYAVTEANHYFVKYNGNGSTSGTMLTGEFIYDTTGYLAENQFTRTGYTWTEWNTNAGGTGTGYENKAKVWNWTATQSGVVPIYAQWNANKYNITYDLNKGTGTSTPVHGASHPEEATYNSGFTVSNPSRQGYAFSGWDITNMDSESHIVGGETTNATSATEVMGTSFKNLNAIDDATVHFAARWTRNPNTTYKVEHYLETLTTGQYPSTAEDVDNLTGPTDTTVTPATNTYTGFEPNSANTPTSGNIDPDGNKVFRYEYVRKSYNLTLNAGRGIALVKGKGTVTAEQSSSTSTTISFKYDEPVTLNFTLKTGYENGGWTGYSGTASSFNMPASAQTKTAVATPIVYTITYDTKSGSVSPANPTTYTIESGNITLNNPNRIRSEFAGWTGGVINGTQLSGPTMTVTIASGSIGNRSYTATWRCLSGYHMNGDQTACLPEDDTEYHVQHQFQNLTGDDYDLVSTTSQTGTTEDMTQANPIAHEGFVIKSIDNKPITGDGSTVVNIRYDRLSYTGTIANPASVDASSITPSANGAHPAETDGTYKYGDTVTLSATLKDGYTFGGWEVKDASGGTVTVTNPTSLTNATFTMPAKAVTITPIVTKVPYTLTIISHGGNNGSTDRTYTVEDTVTLTNPTRDHSDFAGWSGTDLEQPTMNVSFNGRAYDSTYEETWKCHTGYHASGANECVANQYQGKVNYDDGEHGAPETISFTYDQATTLQNPQQSGYNFVGWTITGMSGGVEHYIGTLPVTGDTVDSTKATEFMNLSTEQGVTDITFTANWEPRDDTKYVINHYYKDLGASTYTSGRTDTLTGVTDTDIVFAQKLHNIDGFTYSGGYVNQGSTTRPSGAGVTTGNIDKHGTTVINLYYDRNVNHVYLSGNNDVTLTGEGDYEYGANVEVTATAKTGYHFVKWEKRKADRSKES